MFCSFSVNWYCVLIMYCCMVFCFHCQRVNFACELFKNYLTISLTRQSISTPQTWVPKPRRTGVWSIHSWLAHHKWGEHPYSAAKWTRPLGLNTGRHGCRFRPFSPHVRAINNDSALQALKCLAGVVNETAMYGITPKYQQWPYTDFSVEENACIRNVKNSNLYFATKAAKTVKYKIQ